jgi:23S rRNA pseudouridine2605 synthase
VASGPKAVCRLACRRLSPSNPLPRTPGGTSRRAFIVRLNRYLSQCGLGSRRGCEQIILEGRVVINGHGVRELGTLVKPDDKITVDGKPVRSETPIVIALNKPKGYICTRSDERERMTIYDLLPRQLQTLHHVGRLDKESEGLLLLTNRGDLSHHLIHPSKGAEKEYEVIVDKPLDQAVMAKLVKGMMTEEGHAKAERSWMITEYRCHVVLKQGLKRQIRLMFYQLGFEVERLTRTRIGWLEVKGLPKGSWKQLSETEVQRFFTEAGTTGREKPAVARKSAKTVIADARDDADEVPARRPRGKRPETKLGAEKRSRYGKPSGGKTFSSRSSKAKEGKYDERPSRGPRGKSLGGKSRPERGFGKPSGGKTFSPRSSSAFDGGNDEFSEREARGPRAGGQPSRSRGSRFGKPASSEERPRSSYGSGSRGGKPTGERFSSGSGRSGSKPSSARGGGFAKKQPSNRRSGPRGR